MENAEDSCCYHYNVGLSNRYYLTEEINKRSAFLPPFLCVNLKLNTLKSLDKSL